LRVVSGIRNHYTRLWTTTEVPENFGNGLSLGYINNGPTWGFGCNCAEVRLSFILNHLHILRIHVDLLVLEYTAVA